MPYYSAVECTQSTVAFCGGLVKCSVRYKEMELRIVRTGRSACSWLVVRRLVGVPLDVGRSFGRRLTFDVRSFVRWVVGSLVRWFVARFLLSLVGSFIDWFVDWLVGCFAGSFFLCFFVSCVRWFVH